MVKTQSRKASKVETWLPVFSGFYGTIWETDGDEENELYEINQQRKEKGLEAVSWDDVTWSYDEYKDGVTKGITHHVEADLKTLGMVSSLTFQSLRSPREYNFHNDAIDVEIVLTDKNKSIIKAYLKKNLEAFTSYIKDRYTSYDGFFSSYSNDVYSWLGDLDETLTHSHKLGSVLNFVLLNENGEDYEQSIWENLSGNGVRLYAENFDALIEK